MDESIRERIRLAAAREPGPFYLYEKEVIRSRCRRFQEIPYEPKLICFASMANAHPEFLAVVRESGLGIFVNSVGHLDLARQVGFDAGQMVFTSSAMEPELMRRVQASGARLNLDSCGQLAQWRGLFPGQPVGIRCNIGSKVTPRKTRGGFFLGPESRLGLSIEEIECLADARDICGLHLYLGTDIRDLEYFYECYKQIVRLARSFPALEFLDFGGGFGVTNESGESFDFAPWQRYVNRLMQSVSRDAGRPILLILEPGRIIGAEAAHFVCRVTDIKWRQGRQLVGVNGSSAQFSRPLLYPDDARHPVTLLPATPRDPSLAVPSSIYGCSTYSRDFLARDVQLPEAQLGDLVAFGHAGSYCASSRTEFLGFPPAAEFFE